MRGWEAFDPDGILLRQEAFALSSRAADWADEHGGCAKLKPMCG